MPSLSSCPCAEVTPASRSWSSEYTPARRSHPRASVLPRPHCTGGSWWTIATVCLLYSLPCSFQGRGDSYDNALAETIIGLYKTEPVYRRGPWSRLEDVELATLEWVWWFNNHRLLKPIGLVPPAEHEEVYYNELNTPAMLETLNTDSLR